MLYLRVVSASFHTSEKNGRLVLTISGSFDSHAAVEIRPEIDRLIQRPEDVVVDASELCSMDSAGLAALVLLHKTNAPRASSSG